MGRVGWCGLKGTSRDRERKQSCLSPEVSNSISLCMYLHFCWFYLLTHFKKEQTHHLTQETVVVPGFWCGLEDLTSALWDGAGPWFALFLRRVKASPWVRSSTSCSRFLLGPLHPFCPCPSTQLHSMHLFSFSFWRKQTAESKKDRIF